MWCSSAPPACCQWPPNRPKLAAGAHRQHSGASLRRHGHRLAAAQGSAVRSVDLPPHLLAVAAWQTLSGLFTPRYPKASRQVPQPQDPSHGAPVEAAPAQPPSLPPPPPPSGSGGSGSSPPPEEPADGGGDWSEVPGSKRSLAVLAAVVATLVGGHARLLAAWLHHQRRLALLLALPGKRLDATPLAALEGKHAPALLLVTLGAAALKLRQDNAARTAQASTALSCPAEASRQHSALQATHAGPATLQQAVLLGQGLPASDAAAAAAAAAGEPLQALAAGPVLPEDQAFPSRRTLYSLAHRVPGEDGQQLMLSEAFQDPHCTPFFPLTKPPQAPAGAPAEQLSLHAPAQATSRRALAALTQRSDSAMAMGFYSPPAAHAGGKQPAGPTCKQPAAHTGSRQPAEPAVQPAAAEAKHVPALSAEHGPRRVASIAAMFERLASPVKPRPSPYSSPCISVTARGPGHGTAVQHGAPQELAMPAAAAAPEAAAEVRGAAGAAEQPLGTSSQAARAGPQRLQSMASVESAMSQLEEQIQKLTREHSSLQLLSSELGTPRPSGGSTSGRSTQDSLPSPHPAYRASADSTPASSGSKQGKRPVLGSLDFHLSAKARAALRAANKERMAKLATARTSSTGAAGKQRASAEWHAPMVIGRDASLDSSWRIPTAASQQG